MPRRIYLLVAALLLIGLFFTIPQYCNWLFGFIMHPPISYADEFKNLDPEQRRTLRYGNTYVICMHAVNTFERANIQDPVILLPPVGYSRDMGVLNADIGDPAEFYYFTGYKGVWATSPGVGQARWALVPNEKGVMLKRIDNQQDMNSLLLLYLKYKPAQ